MPERPAGTGEAYLERNLTTLAALGSPLALRLCWAARSEHVELRPGSGAALRRGVRFDLDARECAEWAARAPSRGPVLALGVGLGEGVEALLERAPERRVIAWDRDPWLLRLALQRHDWSGALSSGRLELALGVDLLNRLAGSSPAQPLWHPRLRPVYRLEGRLVRRASPAAGARVWIGVDELLAEELAGALFDRDCTPVPVDFASWAPEELDLALRCAPPNWIASINPPQGLIEFCAERGQTLLAWEVDPRTAPPPRVRCDVRQTWYFTYRRAHVALHRERGLEQVHYLPLASDPLRRRPLSLSAAERVRFGAPVAFVGSSLQREAEVATARFGALWARTGRRGAARTLIDTVLDRQRQDWDRDAIADDLEALAPGFSAECAQRAAESAEPVDDPALLLGQLAAGERRRVYVRALAPHGICVWGDPGWTRERERGVEYRGWAGHHYELARIYSACPIQVDIGRLYQRDIATLRVFEVLACGGFLIAEWSEALAELFALGAELESYACLDELVSKVAFYRGRPEARARIARRGLRALRQRHTVQHRLGAMLGEAGLGPQPRVGAGARALS